MSVQQRNLNGSSEIYKKISKFVPENEWKVHAPLIEKINKLKKEKNAIILAHNYQTPEIYHGVADIAADSLALAVEAAKTSANKIIMCGRYVNKNTIDDLTDFFGPEFSIDISSPLNQSYNSCPTQSVSYTHLRAHET